MPLFYQDAQLSIAEETVERQQLAQTEGQLREKVNILTLYTHPIFVDNWIQEEQLQLSEARVADLQRLLQQKSAIQTKVSQCRSLKMWIVVRQGTNQVGIVKWIRMCDREDAGQIHYDT